jgi:dihydropteroate synthase
MGIVNVTPDSFSDGGRFLEPDAAAAHGIELAGQGADVLDVGGESTRPGAAPVLADEELRWVILVVERLAATTSVPISVDTTKAAVAAALRCRRHCRQRRLRRSGRTRDPGSRRRGRRRLRRHAHAGEPHDTGRPAHDDVVAEVGDFLADRRRTRRRRR